MQISSQLEKFVKLEREREREGEREGERERERFPFTGKCNTLFSFTYLQQEGAFQLFSFRQTDDRGKWNWQRDGEEEDEEREREREREWRRGKIKLDDQKISSDTHSSSHPTKPWKTFGEHY